MATVIFCDGLAGDGKLKFVSLSKKLADFGHHVRFVNIDDVRTHDDRIRAVHDEVNRIRYGDRVVLIGFSAGGSACHITSHKIRVVGEVLITPTIPKGYFIFTPTLVKCMLRHIAPLICSTKGELSLTLTELDDLSGPLDLSRVMPMIQRRRPVSLPEARELAFRPPKFQKPVCPLFYCYGALDRWVNPNAHRRYAKNLQKLSTSNAPVTVLTVNCGHDVLSSINHEYPESEIARWIGNISN